MPTVSIILPTYKNPPYLDHAVKSVQWQSFCDWELIIVDDGLTAEAKQAVADFVAQDQRISVVSNIQNLGIQKSLNKGLALARGKYIARIDDDDQWVDAQKLEKQVKFLEENPDYVLTGTDGFICDEKLKRLELYSMPKSDLEIRNRILFKNCFLHSTAVIRRETLNKTGGYLEGGKVRHVEDYDLWLRLGLQGKITNLDFQAVRIMVNPSSVTFKNRIKQAWRDIFLTFRYRKNYPYFCFALAVSLLRFLFFGLNFIFPIPNKVLYKIQAMYKAI